MEKIYVGVPIDQRSPEEKAKDWMHDMVASSAGEVKWEKKSKARFFSTRDQAQSLSCMAQSCMKMVGIENHLETGEFKDFSALIHYRGRQFFPDGGMSLFDSLNRATLKDIVVLESDLPSQKMTEKEMNTKKIVLTEKMKQDAEMYRQKAYVQFPVQFNNVGKITREVNIDDVARIVDQGKAVQIILYFLGNEYWREVPRVLDKTLGIYEGRTSRHGVTIVDRYINDQGEKTFLVEDSAGNDTSIGGSGQREITEEFMKARCYGAGYVIDKENVIETAPKLLITLRKGSKGEQVKVLQKMLKGLVVDGSFGPLTERSVKKFQTEHGLAVDGIVGPKTRFVLNNL
jgi:peptidoglycan hydrolase-like protein with peptidoglycan-binding domain